MKYNLLSTAQSDLLRRHLWRELDLVDAINGQSAVDRFLVLKPKAKLDLDLPTVAAALNEFFRARGRSVEYKPEDHGCMFLRSEQTAQLVSGVSVLITDTLVTMCFSEDVH